MDFQPGWLNLMLQQEGGFAMRNSPGPKMCCGWKSHSKEIFKKIKGPHVLKILFAYSFRILWWNIHRWISAESKVTIHWNFDEFWSFTKISIDFLQSKQWHLMLKMLKDFFHCLLRDPQTPWQSQIYCRTTSPSKSIYSKSIEGGMIFIYFLQFVVPVPM